MKEEIVFGRSPFRIRVEGRLGQVEEFEAVGDKWLEIRSIDGGQFGIGKDGGGGDEGIEFEASGAPDGIEKAGGFYRMRFAERDDATRQGDAHDGESFRADRATLEFPPCHAGNGGLGKRAHEPESGFTMRIRRVGQGDQEAAIEVDHGRAAKSSRVPRS